MLGVELLGRRVILCWSIWETARLFAQGAAPFDIPPALCEWGPVSLHHPETLTDSPAVPTGNLPAWSITVETCILQWDSVLKKRQLHCSPSPHTLLSSLVSDSVCNSGLALSLMPLFFAYCFALFLWSFFFEIGKLEDSRVYVFKRFLTHDTRVHIRKVNSWWSVPPWSGSKKGQGTSLVVQWLGLGSFTAGARIWSLVENWDPTCLEGGPKNWGAWGWRTRGEAKDF